MSFLDYLVLVRDCRIRCAEEANRVAAALGLAYRVDPVERANRLHPSDIFPFLRIEWRFSPEALAALARTA